MLWRQLDKRELSAEPDPARTGCVQEGLTHSEKKKEGRPRGGKSVVKQETKEDVVCIESVRMGRECIERLKIAVDQVIFE